MSYQNTGVGMMNQQTAYNSRPMNSDLPWNGQQQNWVYGPTATTTNYSGTNQIGQQMYPAQNNPPIGGTQQQIPARFVNEERDIKIQEIPMDGVAVFLTRDLQTVYLKTFDIDGVHGNTYDLRQAPNGNQDQNDPLQLIMERLDRIERSLNTRRQNSRSRAPKQNNRPKEVENHDE